MTGQTIEKDVAIERSPMFIKSGAIIPMAENQIYNLMNDDVNSLHIIFAPDVDSSFEMYDDDGKTNNYKNVIILKQIFMLKQEQRHILILHMKVIIKIQLRVWNLM